ncbi:UV DNA damage repair endonuclease UvsE [Paenibacillus thalictri]|uniref:UV DNA damage repair endonuclease UvsE n=1 Tax=Paenibacillus thalictri TaxID=2527873 RepID=A0A4Q9DHX0_9BACL|nr:UV DNA damage repair endonuclease UvsE [Paenibacillus thalictri]TBL71158.1 UV DNA damage repair endonuclease UvsE [Paenibacillus thalictri]
MIVRLGYVAMSMVVENASPSKTMTATHFAKLLDREAATRKLERIAAENLHNTLRLLRHNRAHDIHMYRFSSKLVPLIGHDLLEGWNPISGVLAPDFAEIGDYVRTHAMRVSFHPDHFTVLSTPREDVLRSSVADLDRHVQMLEAMGLDERAKCNIHIGGAYGSKETAGRRFIRQFAALPESIKSRITLENDDKTFNAAETLALCEQVGAPMVLDIHHHQVNNEGERADELWPRILKTWETASRPEDNILLPPKIHVSSPKDERNIRGHADYIELPALMDFLRSIAELTPELDVMIEAKMKDKALFRLMEDIQGESGVREIDQASFELMT